MKPSQKDALEEMLQMSLRAMSKKGQKPDLASEVKPTPCETCGKPEGECDCQGAEGVEGVLGKQDSEGEADVDLTPEQIEKLKALFSASKG